jgi:hydroxymethylpyrimidine pyrophosphatase-like HAD family hydrolase
MIVRALACDYDGTLATQDRIGPEALAALARARVAGLQLILVTGRTFFELTRVCERLDLFDAVVAENGAVLYFPPSGSLRDQAPAPAPRFLAELDRRDVPYRLGRVIVDTARAHERAVREALDAARVELDLVYNRAALMLVPPGLSKGSGLRQVINERGLSFHDVLGIGDAENDVSLFDAAGLTACPADAVPALRERADWIFEGEDGRAVADGITRGVLGGALPLPRAGRHQIQLGWAPGTTQPVTVPARGVNVLIHGDPLSGKSWLAGAFFERLAARRYAVLVIDPEGDYRVLGRLPGVASVEVRSEAAMEGVLAEVARDPAMCLVADLSGLPHARKLRAIERGLARIRDLRARLGRPHWVMLDEAHYSLHREGVAEAAIGLEARGFCLATYRPSWIRPSVVKACDVFLLARATADEELAFLRPVLAELGEAAARAVDVLPDLPPGEFVLVQGRQAGAADPVTFVPGPRETLHVRHRRKYADTIVPAAHRFHFCQPDGRPVAFADGLASFRRAVAAVDPEVLAFHAGRSDFSRWVQDVFSDGTLAHQLRKTEARWRRREIADLRRAIERLITQRYGLP